MVPIFAGYDLLRLVGSARLSPARVAAGAFGGVMGALEPLRDKPGHELCVMVQGVAPTKEMAEELTMIGLRQMFYARLPDVKGTAGSVAFPLDEVLHASPAYRWTLNHTVEVDDPMELFKTHLTDAGI